MIVAENIVNAYKMRQPSTNWATWAMEHRELAALLAEAEKLANANS